jgi:uncharacterized repeat protein (TIGR01451 family)
MWVIQTWFCCARLLLRRLARAALGIGFFLALLSMALPAGAVQRNLAPRFTLNAAGDITIASNINVHCSTAIGATGQASCASDAQVNSAGTRTNNNHTAVNVDVDADASTFNSSRARLLLPAGATVAFAGLYWAGDTTAATRNQVRLATPSNPAYVTVTASQVDDSAAAGAGQEYQSFADVTSIVSLSGAGTYTVANVTTTVGTTNVYAGWSLVVVYRLASEPTRNMVVYDGYRRVAGAANVDVTLSGFTTPPFGTVTSKLGIIGYDGDRGSTEGAAGLLFGTSTAALNPVFNALNPQTDVFNSTISTLGVNNADRTPNYLNTLGYDADMFSPNTQLPNGATTAVIRVTSSGETIDLGVVTLATNIFVPNIKDSFTKSVVDLNGGLVVPGDILEYTINFANTGNDPATRTVVVDELPPNVTYVPNSIVLSSTSSGMPTGARTDAAGDDSAEYVVGTNRIVARVGRSATAVVGGQFNPGDGQQLRFRVEVNAGTAGDTVIDNFSTVTYRATTVGTDQTDLSDADAATPGDQPARVVVASPDLLVSKNHTPSVFTQASNLPGTPTFSIVVTNSGTVPSFGTVSVSDVLPAGMTATSISGVGWACNLGTVSCTRSDVLAGGAAYPTITLTVDAGVAGSFTNTVTTACACESAAKTGNNTGTDTVAVSPSANLSITKTNAEGTLTAGQTVAYVITVGNAGPSGAVNAVVTDPAAAGLVCTSVTCANVSGSPTCPASPIAIGDLQSGLPIPSLPANSSLALTVICGVSASGQ